MDKNKQRIAIAEACGWTEIKTRLNPDDHEVLSGVIPNAEEMDSQGATERAFKLPNYLNDLNVIHKAFAMQPHLTQLEIIDRLVANKPAASPLEAVAYSTAEDWAKAFLEALSLWRD